MHKILISVLLAAAPASASEPVRRDTPQGVVEGRSDNGIEMFKGIPYTAPPLGPMRWRPPGDQPHWTGVRDASAFGPVCVQKAPATARVLASSPQSEDCLTLNIWRPADAKNAPVMVWIHGGANMFGSGSEPFYDGAAFARRGIVLVTINYRLGYLGFFGHPALKEGGGNLVNYGLLDQIAALKWVKDNITAYGGDPARVTMFGESAGGGAVLNLLAAPSARGLFAQAIVQSGGGLPARKDAGDATKAGQAIAAALGLKDATADALRALPAERFFDAAVPRPEPGFGAVPGGAEVAEPPLAAIRAGRAANVPLLIGVNSNEGSLVDSWGMKDEQVLALLGGRGPVIADAYGSATTNRGDFARRLYGDVIFLYPARAIARAQQRRAPVWLYYFDYLPEGLRAQQKGVNHAGEIPFVFDMSASLAQIPRTERDLSFAKGVNGCFAAFATGGKPSASPLCSAWAPYDAKADNWFVFRDPPAGANRFAERQLDAIGAVLRQLGLD